MGRSIDPPRQPRRDDDPGGAEPGRQILRQPAAVGRGVPSTDHGDHRLRQQFGPAENAQHRRRIINRSQCFRIEGFAPAHEAATDAIQCSHFALGLSLRKGGDGSAAVGFSSEPGQCFQCCSCRAESAQQGVERDRADGFGAAEAQPVEALLRVELAPDQRDRQDAQPLRNEIRLSVPANNRWMFSRCRTTTRMAISAARG